MNRTITIFVALFALACANVVRAQTTLETFETATANATSFTSAGTVFDIVSHNSALFYIQAGYPGTGWSGTANDNRYIDNTAPAYTGFLPDFSIKTHDGSRFTVGSFWLYLSKFVNLASLGSGGSVTLTGKLAGTTMFTASASSGFNTSTSVSNGFSKIDLTTFGGNNNASQAIDEIEIVTGGNFEYVSLDALTWTKAVGYTVGTAVTPSAAYGTLTCVLTSVSPGGSTTCTATPSAGYELDNISGCGGSVSHSTSFSTGAINANCTVTAAFVIALSASTTASDASCNGGSNGVAAVTATNGIAPYTYSWSPAGGTGSIASGLAAGTYTVTVTDGRNIQVQKSATINQPSVPLALSPASIADGVVGLAYSQGFSAAGGTPGYTYAVTSGAVPGLSISGSTLSGTPSAANSYNVGVTVTDANSCTNAKSYAMQVRATMGLLSVSDAADFAVDGQALDYLVTLSNTTSAAVSGIHVTATLSSALDASTATWQCLNNGSNGVVCNGASNSGALDDTATIPAGQTAQWTIHATVVDTPAAGSADVDVSASYATPATDSDTLVIFRDGFDGK